MFTPARRRGEEMLDDPTADTALSLRSLRDVALANRLFGGRRAVLQELARLFQAYPTGRAVTLLDVGTGLGDIPAGAAKVAAARGLALHTTGMELAPQLARAAAANCACVVAGNAMQLPFPDASIDILTCSQVLHHFDGEDAARLLRECTRVARAAVVVGDLRRSWFAVAGLWASSYALGFHPVSRHDGMLSVLRGYTPRELQEQVEAATGRPCRVTRHPGFRITAVWSAR
jgi:SAM-dependent methyltransferase